MLHSHFVLLFLESEAPCTCIHRCCAAATALRLVFNRSSSIEISKYKHSYNFTKTILTGTDEILPEYRISTSNERVLCTS